LIYLSDIEKEKGKYNSLEVKRLSAVVISFLFFSDYPLITSSDRIEPRVLSN